LLLKVSTLNGEDFLRVANYPISADSVSTLLQRNKKKALPSGSIVDLGTRGTVRVYVFKFNDTTKCSDASADHIQCRFVSDSKLPKIPLGLRRHVAWSFYSLVADIKYDLKKDFISAENGQLKVPYTFRRPDAEENRVEALHMSIHDYFNLKSEDSGIQLKRIHSPGITNGYCQFTGGGDIHLEKLTDSLVIYSGPEMSKDITQSPIHNGETISDLTIEGIKTDESFNKLLGQLYANTILTCVTTFLNKCEKKYDAAFIKDVKQISGYGIAYTGMGCVGFYKLQIGFDGIMEFQTKFPLAQYPQPQSAAIVDYALDYFMGKVTQNP